MRLPSVRGIATGTVARGSTIAVEPIPFKWRGGRGLVQRVDKADALREGVMSMGGRPWTFHST
jgi:hypothetical protein